jgi:predicted DNA-binding protein
MAKAASAEARRVAANVNLTAGLLDRIDRLAESTGRSRSAVIREALEHLLEDAEDIAVSEARLRDADDELVPWEEVKAEAGL